MSTEFCSYHNIWGHTLENCRQWKKMQTLPMNKVKPKIDQPTVAESKSQRWKKHLPRFEKQQSITPEEFRKACYDALDDMKLRCFWCGTRGHAYDVCVKLRDYRKNKLQLKESCRVITISEEQSEDSVNQVRQSAGALEDGDSAWIAYNTPSRDYGARRMEYRLLEIDNDLRRVQIDVRTLATNIDCVAMAIKNMKEQLKEILNKLNTFEKTRVETCQTVTCSVDSNTKEDKRAEDSFQITLKSGKVLPERQGHPQNSKDKEIQINEEAPTSSNQGRLSKIEYNILSHLRKVPALLSVYDALMMSKELRDVLIYALQNPEPFYAYFAEMNMKEALYSRHIANVIFTDEDMLLGTGHHNRPLYVTGTSDGEKINRILIDPGSSVNILTLRTLKSLALNVDHLSSEKILIQGFNQHSQKALGSIILPIKFGALRTDVKFYVINADTSYKALLGRPWLHEYNVVPSTLHQCMKYIKDEEEFRIDGDIRPFGVHEIRYEDARYFAESEKDIKLSCEPEEREVQSDRKLSKGKIKIEDNKENVIPHFGSDSEDSDDEEQLRKMLETFSFKLNKPWGEDSSEDEDIFSIYESNMVTRTPEVIEDSLTITRVPCGHMKSLHISEPTKVNDLKTFFVPPRVEKVRGKEKIKKGILFYKSDDYRPSDLIKLDNSDEEMYEDVNIPTYFSKNLKNMMNSSGFPIRRSRANRKFFQKMWNPPQKRVVLPNGRTVHTRGLGYHQPAHVSNKSQCSYKESIGMTASETGQLNLTSPMTEITYNDSCAIRHTCTMITIKDMKQDEDIELIKTKLLELKDAPQELEDGGQATVDELLEINLGDEEDRRPTYISALLPEKDQDVLKALLIEYKDCFAWTYKEMPGLDPSVAVHKLAISPDVVPVKQAPRRTRVDLEEQIITETKKLIEAGFIREEKYADWIASIVPVKKKNGQIRICVDFRDLNKACPKDDFPLPVTELMIDNTSSYEMFSFMDGSSGYNQIKMAPEDEKHTAFRTPIGIYCYKVMPFGLKNAGATYQRAMTIIFDDLLHKVVECYVDDLVVKTVNKANHFEDLRTVFTRLRKYNLKMNPLKCAFGVYSGKFLGFIVRHRGIEIDPAKIKAT